MPWRLSQTFLVFGWLLLGLSSCLPWFALPVSFEPTGAVQAFEPGAAYVYRETALVFWFALLVTCCSRSDWRKINGYACAGLFVLLLLFPAALAYFSTRSSAAAYWFYTQHGSLTTWTGELFTAHEYRDVLWKSRINVTNAPLMLGSPVPRFELHAFNGSYLLEVIAWLGYSPAFCFAVKKGFCLAIAAVSLMLVGLCRREAGIEIERVKRFVQLIAIGTVLGVGIVLSPYVAAGYLIRGTAALVESGKLLPAGRQLEWAAQILPPLRENGAFIRQQGYVDFTSGKPTPQSTFFRAELAEEKGEYDKAEADYRSLLFSAEARKVLSREVQIALLRRGVERFNSGELESARELLELCIEADPAAIRANYALQLLYLRQKQVEPLEQMVNRMATIYSFFHSHTIPAVLAWSHENLALAEFLNGNIDRAVKELILAKTKT